MIPVDGKIKAAFQSDSMPKYYKLQFTEVEDPETHEVLVPEKVIESNKIKSDSISLTEPMCSEEQLHYGCNEAATFECEVEYDTESLVGRLFNVYLQLGDYSEPEDIFTVGRYLVDGEELSSDRRTKKITAYDINYILNLYDVTYWLYSLEFPMTIKQIRDSLFDYLGGFTQVEKILPNDHIVLYENPLYGELDITFEKIIKGILEWNGVFGHINRNGSFDYISLTPTDNTETRPSKDTFPAHYLHPKSIKGRNYYINPHLIKSDITWQNYKCRAVDIVQVRDKAGNAIAEYHLPLKNTYTNIYVIKENWITDGLDEQNLQEAVINFANAIQDISYTPCDANLKMDLSLEVGDAITLTGTDGTRIPTYIFTRTMTGTTSAFDAIEATGYEEWINDPPSNDGAVDEIMDELVDLNDRLTDVESKQASGEGSIRIESVPQLPSSPKKNVLYLVQGSVYVR